MIIGEVTFSLWLIPLTCNGPKSCCTSMALSEIVCCTATCVPPVSWVEPPVEPDDALIVEVPPPTPVASPEEFTVVTAALVEFQVTELVNSSIVPSLYTPMAANCCVAPIAIAGVAGVTVTELSDGLAAESAVSVTVKNCCGVATDQFCEEG